jgi:TetR/AcrR family transcriptional regulator
MRPTIRSPAPEHGPRASRAIERLLEATRTVFLARGYAGTSIDEIARVAGVSRPSFYTYFPTKRDALLALGLASVEQSEAVDRLLEALPQPWNEVSLRQWVDARWTFLDDHAAFSLAWTQASHEDENLRVQGMRRHLRAVRFLGEMFGGKDRQQSEHIGLVVFAMIERSWMFCEMYRDRVDHAAVRAEITRAILGMIPPRLRE